MKVSVLIPRRSDGGRRDDLWRWVRNRWDEVHPSWDVIEGHDDDGPFNRGAAINAAAAESDADVFVIGDSDTFVSKDSIETAATWALDPQKPGFVLAYDTYNYLSRFMSDLVMAGDTGWWGRNGGIEWSMTGTCSSMLAVPRSLFETVGGFDEGFEGWGFEDVAFSLACQTLGGGMLRVPGDAWHLWHVPSPENNSNAPEWVANRERHLLYRDVAYDAEGMRSLLAELGVT